MARIPWSCVRQRTAVVESILQTSQHWVGRHVGSVPCKKGSGHHGYVCNGWGQHMGVEGVEQIFLCCTRGPPSPTRSPHQGHVFRLAGW